MNKVVRSRNKMGGSNNPKAGATGQPAVDTSHTAAGMGLAACVTGLDLK